MASTTTLQQGSTEKTVQDIHWCEQSQRLELDWSEALGYPCKLIVNSWDNGVEWWSELADETHRSMYFEEPGLNFLAETNNQASSYPKTLALEPPGT